LRSVESICCSLKATKAACPIQSLKLPDIEIHPFGPLTVGLQL
jgi:hypothetical protein